MNIFQYIKTPNANRIGFFQTCPDEWKKDLLNVHIASHRQDFSSEEFAEMDNWLYDVCGCEFFKFDYCTYAFNDAEWAMRFKLLWA